MRRDILAIPKRTKKKTVRASRRVGVNAAPIEKGLESVQIYFQNEVSRKEAIDQVKTFVKNQFSKSDAKFILCNPEYKFLPSYYSAGAAFWCNSGLEETERSLYWKDATVKRLAELVEPGKALHYEKLQAKHDSDNVVSLSPQQRLQRKINNTIMQDLLDLEDKWIEGEDATLDLYQEFRRHGLPNSATKTVRYVVDGWLQDYNDAYTKACPDAVEGYSHLSRVQLRKRVQACESMLADLDRLQSAAKATRKLRVKQPKAADKQVAKLKYKKEDNDYKIVSVAPLSVIGSHRLFTFNVKTRVITEFVTSSAKGFEVSGTTLKNIDTSLSRSTRLRKPDAFIPIVLSKTTKQIDNEWKSLTTKTTVPNGRMSVDTVLLKVMDK